MARRTPLEPGQPSLFTPEVLESLAYTLQRSTLDRQTVSDDVQTGLRAIINKSGEISIWANYHVGNYKEGNKRPLIGLGTLKTKKNPNGITIDDAREITKTIRYLGEEYGMDIAEEWHKRLLKELREYGTRWRPSGQHEAAEKAEAKAKKAHK